MTKAYLLVICLLAASFTGCLTDDTSDSVKQEESTIEQEENTEEQTVEPVGTNNSNTEDYEELGYEFANLTNEINELNNQIDVLTESLQNLETEQYTPPLNSSITFTGDDTESDRFETVNATMVNGTTIIVDGDIAWHNTFVFYNYYGAVILYGHLNEIYDYCKYFDFETIDEVNTDMPKYDDNGTALGEYNLTDGKSEKCSLHSAYANMPSSSYVIELPYQPTSMGFSQYKTYEHNMDQIRSFY